ncbi:hypothetical protein AAG570_011318 [Ranatra chinensis]|uniref:Uncharacterized protein n=1 Tax=Ranatra chinensis TaxID=642074 RepID=A0ABD0YKA1_9HEMI
MPRPSGAVDEKLLRTSYNHDIGSSVRFEASQRECKTVLAVHHAVVSPRGFCTVECRISPAGRRKASRGLSCSRELHAFVYKRIYLPLKASRFEFPFKASGGDTPLGGREVPLLADNGDDLHFIGEKE